MKIEQISRQERHDLLLRMRHRPAPSIRAMVGQDRTIAGSVASLTRDATPTSPDPFPSEPEKTIDKSALIVSPTTVRLGMFGPQNASNMAPLIRYYVGRDIDIVAARANPETQKLHEERRWQTYRRYHLHVTREQYDIMRDEQLRRQADKRSQRINRNVYQRLAHEFGLGSVDDENVAIQAEKIFETQRQQANGMVKNNAEQVFPGDVRTQQRNEVDLPQKPAELIDMFFSTEGDSDQTLISEIQRQTLLTTISMQIEAGVKQEAGRKLTKIQNLLNEQLFTGNRGSTVTKKLYGVFYNDTNAIAVDDYGQPVITETEPKYDAADGFHYKRFELPMRTRKETGEEVLMFIGEKERTSAISKALNYARKRAEKGKGDDIRAEDIEDTHRLMLIVNGDDKAAEQLLTRVYDIVTDGANALTLCSRNTFGKPITNNGELTGLPIDFHIEYETNEGNGASDKIGNKRIKIDFDGLDKPIEIIVRPLYNHLLTTIEVGNYDPETNTYDGAAHPIYKNRRETAIAPLLWDTTTYPDIIRPYIRDTNGEFSPHAGLERAVRELREYAVFIPNGGKNPFLN